MVDAKKHKLRPGRSPQKNPRLSGVVYVLRPSGRAYAYVRFEQSLVAALGRKMPRGLSMDSPGYLKLMHTPGRQIWRLYCMYVGEEKGILLKEYNDLPEWLGKIRES